MKPYDSAIPEAMPVTQPTPLVVQAIGGGATLFVVTVILLGLVLEVDMTRTLKTGAILFCAPLLLLAVSCLSCVAEAMLERLVKRDLNRSGAVGDRPDIRLVPVRGSSHTIGGVEPEDWRYFVTTICATKDWTQATWRGVRMPSGRKCDNDYWTVITSQLKRLGIIVNASPGATGELAEDNPAVILEMLGVNE